MIRELTLKEARALGVTCLVEGCDRPVRTRGRCASCYRYYQINRTDERLPRYRNRHRREAGPPGLCGPWVRCARCKREVTQSSTASRPEGRVCVRCQIWEHEKRVGAASGAPTGNGGRPC